MLTVRGSSAGSGVARQRKLLHGEAGPRQGGTDWDQQCPRVTISALPDDVLLEIFVYVLLSQYDPFGDLKVGNDGKGPTNFEDPWRTLVHVCKRWRFVVFASPRRLNLQLLCTNRRQVKKMLDVWPPILPIYIFTYRHRFDRMPLPGVANIMAALKEHHRVCGIFLDGVPDSLLEAIVSMKSFPALEQLGLRSYDERAPVLPDSFLGGSAPRLRTFRLIGIPFPGLGKLLLSTTDLVSLSLRDMPQSGYISPEAMVSSLSTLTRLRELDLQLRSPRSRADRENRHPPPVTHAVLPALTRLQLKGDSEYLEDIFSRIDAPLLDDMKIMFFHQRVFDTPQLRHFISRTGKFKAPDRAFIHLFDDDIGIDLFQGRLLLYISCKPSDVQLSSLAQLYCSALSPLPALRALEIHGDLVAFWKVEIEDTQWLELLRLFASVEDLVVSGALFRLVASALNNLTEEMETEVLPMLQNICLHWHGSHLYEPVGEAIGKFIAKRRLLHCPVTLYHLTVYQNHGMRWESDGR